jgi:redox-sensitive bicupin YhaK (pirin superfamily)
MEATQTRGAETILNVERLSRAPWQTRDPFLFCVHHVDHYPVANATFGPAASLAGRNLGQDFANVDGWNMYHGDAVPGFPSHPHRGFETVTVVRRGLIDHSDSLGAAARYGRGDVQWLTAGGGIQHSEMFPLLDQSAPNPAELFQIWLNLPRASKMVAPHFSMLWGETIPKRTFRDEGGRETELVIVAGAHEEMVPPSPPPSSWASQPGSDVSIWTIKMQSGARWTLPPAPAGTNRTLYFFAGSGLRVGGRAIPAGHLVDLRPDASVVLESGEDGTELLLLGGRPIGEPVVQYGPFVMNTQGEIRQAFADFQRTRFGGWPWESDEPVHGREDRFARHADGRVERPA